MKDVGTDPMVEDFTEPVTETSPELFVNKDHQPHIDSSANCASQVRLTPMLSNMEQQSINELFKVGVHHLILSIYLMQNVRD